MILTLFTWLLSPIGRLIGMTVAAVIVLGGVYYKIQSDAVSRERARVEQENSNAIEKAREARDALRSACDSDSAACVPDDNFRD